jgi:hypothetical protein
MKLAETRGIRGMDSNKQCKIQKFSVYHAKERFSRARELLRFKAVTRDIAQNSLKIINEISAEEMQGENSSPSRIEKYYLLHHYLDYLNRFCEGKV